MTTMRKLSGFFTIVCSAGMCALLTFAQTSSNAADDPARREAFQLYETGKYVAAFPLLEK